MGFLSIISNKNLILGAIFLAVISGQYLYIKHLSSKNEIVELEKASLKVQLDESQANLKQLQNDITRQNEAVEQLKKDADIRSAKNALEVKAAKAISETYKEHAAELLKRIVPQDVSVCDAANIIINEEIKNVRR